MNYKIQMISAEKQLEQSKSNNGFNATINASYGLNQSGEKLENVYSDFLNNKGFNLTFSVPLYQWNKSDAEIESALANKYKTEYDIKHKKKIFEMDVKYKALEFERLQQNVNLSKKAEIIAQKRFEVTKNRYHIGKIDLNTLFIAQTEKDRAFNAYIQSLRSYWVAYYELRRLSLLDIKTNQKINYN